MKVLLRLVLFVVLATCIIVATLSRVSHSFSVELPRGGSTLTAADRAQARQLLLGGVGSRVSLVREGAGPGQVRTSVDSLRDFVGERSGLDLAPELTDKLAAMEQRAVDGDFARISCDDLSDSVLAVVVDRFRHSTDAEIEQAASQLANVKTRGADAQSSGGSTNKTAPRTGTSQTGISGAAAGAGDRVMLRADGRGIMDQSELIDAAKQYRARMNAPAQMIAIIGIVRPLVRQAFQKRLGMLSQGLPEQWGDAPSRGLAPVQAFLLSYSVVADDPLYRSRQGLEEVMKWVEQVNLKGKASQSYPSPAGRLPYGSSGYLFSTPLDLIFDGQTCSHLLDKIRERTSK
jgi:hypothetical protein